MKHKLLSVALAFLFSAVSASAVSLAPDLSVSASLSQLEYLRGESVVLSGKIVNSGESIFIIDDYGEYLKNKIRIVLKDPATGGLLRPIKGKTDSPLDSLTIRPGESVDFSFDVGDIYDLGKQGRFRVSVLVQRGDEAVVSNPISFSVVEGIEIGATVRALRRDSRHPLRFSLVYWDRRQRQDLFLRITDPSRNGIVTGFVGLGPVVRVAEPTLVIAPDDSITIVHQIARDRFARTKIDASGSTLKLIDRNENLLSAAAVQDEINTRVISDRLDASSQPKEDGGFFGPSRTRVPVVPNVDTAPIQTFKGGER